MYKLIILFTPINCMLIFLFTRGREPVDDGKVIEVYGDTHIPMDLLETDHKVR